VSLILTTNRSRIQSIRTQFFSNNKYNESRNLNPCRVAPIGRVVRFARKLTSVLVTPRALTAFGSLLDFAGPRISRPFRRFLFRICGGIIAASFYRRVTGTSRFEAITGGLIAALLYRWRAFGLENLPANGFLLLPNHTCILDAVLLQLACPRPIKFIADQSICGHAWLNPTFNLVGSEAIPASERRAKQAIRTAVQCIKDGEIICVFPEGELSRTGSLLKLQKGFELIARLATCEAVPVWLDGLSDSLFSFSRGKDFLKVSNRFSLRATIAFGRPIAANSVDCGLVRQKMLELSEFCFQNRPAVSRHIGRAVIAGLKRRQFDHAIIDEASGRSLKRGDLLASSIALSRWMKRKCTAERVGVDVAQGFETIVANIAVALANKIPVSLPADGASAQAAVYRAQISQVISCEPAMKLLVDFPYHAGDRGLADTEGRHHAEAAEDRGFEETEGRTIVCESGTEIYHLEVVMAKLRAQTAFWRIVSLVLPAPILGALIGLPSGGGHKEAAQCFIRSKSGESRGVVLSHRNVMGSVTQLGAVLRTRSHDWLMAATSCFRDSGCTLTIWYPVIEGVPVVIHSPEIEPTKLSELIRRYRVKRLVSTPALLRSFLKEPNAPELEQVQILVAERETLSRECAEAFRDRFGKQVLVSYGLAETTSAAALNIPDAEKDHPLDGDQPSSRPKSVGKLLPGQAAQIRHPITGKIGSPFEPGILWLKGVNIFAGYFDQPEKTAKVLQDGWFQTGELARFDEDGFLFLEEPPQFPGIPREKILQEDRLARKTHGPNGSSDSLISVTNVGGDGPTA
jgi:acyl-[acyl-carrier-protein]-phospholipid O-acyltransferase/long-chain-fatty-acid--[acyl-carrier-protein] ligase